MMNVNFLTSRRVKAPAPHNTTNVSLGTPLHEGSRRVLRHLQSRITYIDQAMPDRRLAKEA
jgi:hypothetical protein